MADKPVYQLTKAYMAETSYIIELLLHESSSKATIDPLLYIAVSLYTIMALQCTSYYLLINECCGTAGTSSSFVYVLWMYKNGYRVYVATHSMHCGNVVQSAHCVDMRVLL